MGEFLSRDFFVDPDIKSAEALPDSAFTDPKFLELELTRIFNRTWILIPHRNPSVSEDPFELGKTGSRTPISILEKPLFLQRTSKSEIKCFPNVCTHAWHPLVEFP